MAPSIVVLGLMAAVDIGAAAPASGEALERTSPKPRMTAAPRITMADITIDRGGRRDFPAWPPDLREDDQKLPDFKLWKTDPEFGNGVPDAGGGPPPETYPNYEDPCQWEKRPDYCNY